MKHTRACQTIALVTPLILCSVLPALAGRYPGSSAPVVNIPAAAFSTDGEDPASCLNYGDRVEAFGSTTLYLHAAVYLPNFARISTVSAAVRDTDPAATRNVKVYLKRTKFGANGITSTIASLDSDDGGVPNDNGLIFPSQQVDHVVDSANYAYWAYVSLRPPSDGSLELTFYRLRIIYEVDDVIFGDTFESTDTQMWSSTVGADKASWTAGMPSAWDPQPSHRQRPEMPVWMHVDDPEAQEALEAAFAGKGYASPLIIPGTAFKSQNYVYHDEYYLSPSYGFLYARSDAEPTGVNMVAPVILPDGAEINFLYAFFVDTRPAEMVTPNIRLWFGGYDTTAIGSSTTYYVYDAHSTGDDPGIRSLVVWDHDMTPANPVIDMAGGEHYWLTVQVAPTQGTPTSWHKLYAVIILYTEP